MGKYQIKFTSNNQYRWTLKGNNHETLLISETYVSKQGCTAGIASSKAHLADHNFDKKTSVSGSPYFNQVANNGQVIGTSEMYSSINARDQGIRAVQLTAPTAIIEDHT